jgi:hypothetical protein
VSSFFLPLPHNDIKSECLFSMNDIRSKILGRIEQATADDHHAYLLDACIVGTADYEI